MGQHMRKRPTKLEINTHKDAMAQTVAFLVYTVFYPVERQCVQIQSEHWNRVLKASRKMIDEMLKDEK